MTFNIQYYIVALGLAFTGIASSQSPPLMFWELGCFGLQQHLKKLVPQLNKQRLTLTIGVVTQ
ncbi:hypothetical protein [Synechocystis sp. PCC 7509]|uniref:hypothetical protein n=1 Tax=Synechocystis sp. PCC 7509 TaxID=927677 RepID=UPI0002F3B933|nr:hypothetical protein [Synechocystis sp. PCC 7509]